MPTSTTVYTWGLLTLVGLLLAGDLAIRMVHADPPVPKTISAQEFRLTDAQGKTRARLGVGQDGGPALTLLDEKGSRRAAVSLTGQGETSLSFYDNSDKMHASLTVLPDGNAGLFLLDKTEKPRMAARLRADGSPVFVLSDSDGKQRALLDVPADKSASLSLKSRSEKGGIGLVVAPDDNPIAVLKDKDGKTVWGASDN